MIDVRGTDRDDAERTIAAATSKGGAHHKGDLRDSSKPAPSPPAPSKLFEPADVVLIGGWLAKKAFFACVPMSALRRLATLRGTLDSMLSPERAGVGAALSRNLKQTPRADEPGRVARRYFQFRRREQLILRWPLIRGFAGLERVEVQGMHHLDEAFAGGKGAILLTAHFGYARLVKPILRLHGRSVLLVGLTANKHSWPGFRPSRTRLGRFVYGRVLRLPTWSSLDARWRETLGTDLPARGLNLRPHLAALARNEALIMLVDGHFARTHRKVCVLGKDVYLGSGSLSMARASGAAALPAFVIDDPEGTSNLGLRLVIHPPLELQVTSDTNADLDVNLARFAAVYAEQLRARPHISPELAGSGPNRARD